LHWGQPPSAAFYKAASAYVFKRNAITKVIAIANTTQASSKSSILALWQQILEYQLMKYHPAKYAPHKVKIQGMPAAIRRAASRVNNLAKDRWRTPSP